MTAIGDDDFSDAPTSIGEVRADRAQRADQWSPREVLIALLRDIDQGKVVPLRLAVIYAVKVADDAGGGTRTFFQVSAEGNHEVLGMLARAAYLINRDT